MEMRNKPLLVLSIIILYIFSLITNCTSTIPLTDIKQYHKFPYPKGKLPCKYYNRTILDCSDRDLPWIPIMQETNTDFTVKQVMQETNLILQFNLGSNMIQAIPDNAFSNLNNLIHLDLSSNMIRNVSNVSFSGLHHLEVLNLAENQIINLPSDVFTDLIHIKELNLDANFLQSIPNAILTPLFSLEILTMDLNNFTSFYIGDGFHNLTNMHTLKISSVLTKLKWNLTMHTFDNLSRTRLSTFHLTFIPFDENPTIVEPGLFQPLRHLTSFKTEGIFQYHQIDSSFPKVNKLTLGVFPNWMKQFNDTTLQNLSHLNSTLTLLYISGKYIPFEGAVFKWFPRLTQLQLQLLSIDSLPDDIFYNLDKLEELGLPYNEFVTIPSNAFDVFAQTNTLKYLDLRNNKISRIGANDLRALTSLTKLSLEGNGLISLGTFLNYIPNIEVITFNVLEIPKNIQQKESMKTITVLPYQNYGDLKDYSLGVVLCEFAPNLESVILSDFPVDMLSSILGSSCIFLIELDLSGCFQGTNFKETQQPQVYMPELQTLHAAHNSLKSLYQLSFIMNSSRLIYLDISDNLISYIDLVQADLYLRHLEHLDITNNNIKSLYFLKGITSLRTLLAGNNNIQQIPDFLLRQLMSNSTLQVLDLSSYHFDCNCKVIPFQNWICTDDAIHLLPGEKYACSNPSSMAGLSITEVHVDCRSLLPQYIGIFLPCIILLCCIIAITVHYRWHIRYKTFLFCNRHRISRKQKEDVLPEMSTNHKYDAYVAYVENSDSDLNWVLNELRPNIEEHEEGKLTLCIKGRDFLLGRAIVDNISESIQQSRKTILVLSQQFVQCEWCYFEMQMAHMRLFQEHMDVIILVLLEDIPDHMMTLTLRQLLCKKQYFRWPLDKLGQRLFWKRLWHEIKKPGSLDRRFDA